MSDSLWAGRWSPGFSRSSALPQDRLKPGLQLQSLAGGALVDLTIRDSDGQTTVALAGDLDSSFALEASDLGRLDAVLQPGRRIILDVSGVRSLSGLGLRALLLLYRRASALGPVAFVGETAHIRDLVEATGFPEMAQGGSGELADLPALSMPRIDVYPTLYRAGFALRPGQPQPQGASPVPGGINFAVFSQHARTCSLLLFMKGAAEPAFEVPFPAEFRVGHVFCMVVFGLAPDRFEYGFRVDGPSDPRHGHRFDPSRVVVDPFACCLVGRETWGTCPVTHAHNPYRACLVPQDFDWAGDRPLQRPIEDLVIYEMHVRGFTASPSSGARFPGTYAGLRQKVPYLKELGVNCVELMPIFEFDECELSRTNPQTGATLVNYWGYNTVGFWAPKAGYAATGAVGLQTDELKALVKALHAAGIEVILDVVFNHTAEGDERGPTLSFRGLDNKVYYLLTPEGGYRNYSGCGNTLNCNHPAVRDFVLDCLRYWVAEYHVDGFRFDLASILARDQDGRPLPNPPLLEALAGDPVLGTTKLIAEAWDAGGLYQVGSFPAYGRWAEWNGRYRDSVRRFLKSDPGLTRELADCLMGSPHLYAERGPTASINFVTCHDGFTLYDLVSYNDKHNEANGEDNRDGANDNNSWNCGVEGPTNDPAVLAQRRRQVKNALAMLLLSQGVPMLLMGDECGRTQQGNNNAYCHDGPLTWFDWGLPRQNAELFRFCRLMIRFRHEHAILRHGDHPGQAGAPLHFLEVIWHGTLPEKPDWSPGSRVLAFTLQGRTGDDPVDVIYVALNAYWEALAFGLPPPPGGKHWHVAVNTAMPSPADIAEPGQEPPLAEQGRILVGGRSVVVLVPR
jgi:glycogen operon protein